MGLAGREVEVEAALRFVDEVGEGPWAVALDGPPGIGKTAVWRALVAALGPAHRVLEVRATAAEAGLAFTGLTDLLADVADADLAALPEPQHEALAAAALRRAAPAEPPDERAVGTALAGLLRRLASASPVLVAVDDLPWLDAATGDALSFALRRVADAPVRLLCASRSAPAPPAVLAGLADGGTPVLRLGLGPLAAGALAVVVGEAAATLPQPLARRVVEAAAGNPLVALELARASLGGGAGGEALVVPDSLHELTAARLAGLGAAGRRAVLATALAARPDVGGVEAVAGRAGLEEAEAAGCLEVAGPAVRLAHPVLGEAAVQAATGPERRRAHAALAVAASPEERARHLARATGGADEAVAAALDEAVALARGRGAALAALELAQLAVERTPDPRSPDGLRRRAAEAALLAGSGDTDGALARYRAVLDDAETSAWPGRSAALLDVVELDYDRVGAGACAAAAERARDLAADPATEVRALLVLAALGVGPDPSAHTARAALLVDRVQGVDPALAAWVLGQQVFDRFDAGEGLDVDGLRRAIAAERTGRTWRSSDQVASAGAALLRFADHDDEALDLLEGLRARALDEGNDVQLPYLLGHLVGAHLRVGDLAQAEVAAAEHLRLAQATGLDLQVAQARFNAGVVALHHGDVEAAAALAGQALDAAAAVGELRFLATARGLVGACALEAGRAEEACADLGAWWRADVARGGDPGGSRARLDHLEALVATGRLDEARTAIAADEPRAERAQRISALAALAHGRALVAAAEGDLAAATAAAERAVELLAALPAAVDRGRALLLLGRLRRRAKEKSRARDALADACAAFEAAGAEAWAGRARAELARVNIRPGAPDQLTPTERRIALLAAKGLTNREVAAAAFVSPKTVEANLARAYRKLGISSRAELGARRPELEEA